MEKKGGHHNCRCADGYVSALDANKSCIATGINRFVLIGTEQQMGLISSNKFKKDSLALNTLKIDEIDMFYGTNSLTLFYIEAHSKKIQKLEINSIDVKSKRTKRWTKLDSIEVTVSFLIFIKKQTLLDNENVRFSDTINY